METEVVVPAENETETTKRKSVAEESTERGIEKNWKPEDGYLT